MCYQTGREKRKFNDNLFYFITGAILNVFVISVLYFGGTEQLTEAEAHIAIFKILITFCTSCLIGFAGYHCYKR